LESAPHQNEGNGRTIYATRTANGPSTRACRTPLSKHRFGIPTAP